MPPVSVNVEEGLAAVAPDPPAYITAYIMIS
jgi:hypothetical protein